MLHFSHEFIVVKKLKDKAKNLKFESLKLTIDKFIPSHD